MIAAQRIYNSESGLGNFSFHAAAAKFLPDIVVKLSVDLAGNTQLIAGRAAIPLEVLVHEDLKAMHRMRNGSVLEILSAATILAAIVGAAVGIMYPNRITGLLFPLALIAWYLLYKHATRNEE